MAAAQSDVHAPSMLPTSPQAMLVPTTHQHMAAATLAMEPILATDSSRVTDLLPRIRSTSLKDWA